MNIQKILSTSIATVMFLNVSPLNFFQKEVRAASYTSNVSKIENPVAGGDNDNWSGNYIYFGHYPQSDTSGATKDPIRWRVLDNNNKAWTGSSPTDNGFKYNIGYGDGTGGRQNAPIGGNGMLLYSDVALDAKQYHPNYEGNDEENKLCWGGGGSGKGCTLWAWLNGYNNSNVLSSPTVPGSSFLANAFSSAEQNVIMTTKVYSEDLNSSRGLASSARTSLTQDKIFVPSYNEMLNTSYGFTNTEATSNTRSSQFSDYSKKLRDSASSWLRSPGGTTYDAYAALLYSDGYVIHLSVLFTFGVCPAFNLNPTSVIFASEAAESGASGVEGDGKKSSAVSSTPAKFELPTGIENEYKLTLHDESRDDFKVSKTAQNGNEITISYSAAKTGDNEYISCMILDDESEIKYYGKLKQVDAESGETTLNLPEELESGEYIVAILNEQCNGDKETDWSSEPIVFEVTV